MKPLPESFLAIGDVHGDLVALDRALGLAERLHLPPVCFGDVVGGADDSACIARLRQVGCLVLRGNHDQWAVERDSAQLTQHEKEWLRVLPLRAENEQTLAVHTNYEVDGERVLWSELQSSLEVEQFCHLHWDKRFLLAAHTHHASLTSQNLETPYHSNASLRLQPLHALGTGQHFIDVGWASDDVVIFHSNPEPTVEFVFFWLGIDVACAS